MVPSFDWRGRGGSFNFQSSVLERSTRSAPAKEASPLFLNGRSHPSFAKEGSFCSKNPRKCPNSRAPKGRKIPWRLFRPFRGWVRRLHEPRADARGYVLMPLRGWNSIGLSPRPHLSRSFHVEIGCLTHQKHL